MLKTETKTWKPAGRRFQSLKLPFAAVALGLLAGGCFKDKGTEDPDPEPTAGCVNDDMEIATQIDSTCTLTEGNTYHFTGLTFVEEGGVLEVEPGVTVKGRSDGELTALIVQPGGKIMAEGTADKPIVFTAGTSSPVRGDFGGVVILGHADINLDDEQGDIEGLTGVPYGGTQDDDNSGVLEYVRIEYAGHLLGTDNELNGLTMGGVGSGTKISYVQVYEGLDDCYEWFGGTVKADHLVAYGCDDDIFDWDLGWRGSLQFAFGAHNETATSSDPNGIEADNLNGKEDNTPRSAPKVFNLTLIGNSNTSLNGIRLRRGTAGHIGNAIVTGFPKGSAVRVDGNGSFKQVTDGNLKAEAIYAYGNGSEIKIAAAAGLSDSAATVATVTSEVQAWFLGEIASLGIQADEPKPANAPGGAVDVPDGLEDAKFIGAFDPDAPQLWTAGWARLGSGPPPVAVSDACVESGNRIKESIEEDCSLPGDKTYHLQGLTFVDDGATLTVGAGAVIKGRTDGDLTALIVQPGGKLVAIGSASKPIVFTAGTDEPQRGDFGGVVVLGKADINLDDEQGDIEGLTGVPYGGTQDDDSSGVLKYVRIEYAGHLLGTDNELNGLTMGGVGSKTVISHVQVYQGLDDCYEWFGGTVKADHLVAYGCDDDIFDWDLGWRGTLQFALGVHDEAATSSDPNGIEADNLNGKEGNTPRSAPQVYNLTLIGNGTTSLNAMRLRRGTAGRIGNAIVTGFPNGSSVRVDGNASIGLVAEDELVGEAIYAYDNGSSVKVAAAAGLADSAATVAAVETKIASWLLDDDEDLGLNATTFKPNKTKSGAVTPPSGFADADYLGAFDPEAEASWMAGWTQLPE